MCRHSLDVSRRKAYGMTSVTLLFSLPWLGISLMSSVGAQAGYDPSVCTPATPSIPLPVPTAELGKVWQAQIEWKDDVKNRTYLMTDTADMTQFMEKVVISVPFLNDVTLIINWQTYDVILQKLAVGDDGQTTLHCEVIKHSPTRVQPYSFEGLFWLSSLQTLLAMFTDSQSAILAGPALVRGVQANKWTACLYDRDRNMTLNASLYFSIPSWMAPHLPPLSQAPLRLQFLGKVHNGSQVTDVSLIGDVTAFQKKDAGSHFPAETFTTLPGAYCPDIVGSFMRFPGFSDALSLVMEIVEPDFTRISYTELYYDRSLKMVRSDEKSPIGDDPDPTTYIADFVTGVKYLIDRYTMVCTPSALNVGDDFVQRLPNGTLDIVSMDSFFHSQTSDIQYVGEATVRDVECNTWIGRYQDPDTGRQTTVQWYFTKNDWLESTGYVQGGGAFFMMKVWKDSIANPKIYNIMKYSNIAPDPAVFDMSACFTTHGKKHFVIEFQVCGGLTAGSQQRCMQALQAMSRPYLRMSVVQQLANMLEIEINRFTDVTFDLESETSTLFLSATLLDRTILTNINRQEISLQGAFDFLRGSIAAGQITFNLTMPGYVMPVLGVGLVEHDYRREFTTTSTTVTTTPQMLVPTLIPLIQTTVQPPTLPPSTVVLSTAATSTTTVPVCVCPTTPGTPTTSPACPKTTCPPAVVAPCPTFRPRWHANSTVRPCPQASSTQQHQCVQQQARAPAASGISSGALAGGVVVALLLGLAIGIIGTRLYHVTRVNPNQMTINLIDDSSI